jgi:triacylglycerol lipase
VAGTSTRTASKLAGDVAGAEGSRLLRTTTPLVAGAAPFCPACVEQTAGSPFLTALNSGDETPGPVSYKDALARSGPADPGIQPACATL